MKCEQEIIELLDEAIAKREAQGPYANIQINAYLAMVQLVEETRIDLLKLILER